MNKEKLTCDRAGLEKEHMRRFARLLGYLGTVGVVVGLAYAHGRFIGTYDFFHSTRLIWTVVYITFLLVSYYASGLPEDYPKVGTALVAGLAVSISGAIGISILQLIGGSAVLPRFVLFLSIAALTPWYAFTAMLARDISQTSQDRDRVLFIGTADTFEMLDEDLTDHHERPATLLEPIAMHDEIVADKVLVSAESQLATVVVISGEAQNDDEVIEAAAQLHKKGIRIRTLGLFYDEWIGKAALPELERIAMMFDVGEVHHQSFARSKRLFDIFIGAIGTASLVVFIPLVFVINLFGNRGKLFYKQERVGRYGTPFRMWKFRTMNSNDVKTEWTTETDSRLGTVSRFLRRTHIDETPQFWNVLKGNLSTVGPRPEQPTYVEQLRADIPFYDVRHMVRPGISGWAQVNRGYGSSIDQAMDKLQYDIWYLRRQSFILDLRILGRTIRAVSHLNGR